MKGFQKLAKARSVYLIYFPLFLLVIFLILFTVNQYLTERIKNDSVFSPPFNSLTLSKYPELKNKFTPMISAKGVVVMDLDSKVVIFDKNPNLRFSLASTTKIMTALTALNYFKLSDILTVIDPTTEGAVAGLKRGVKISFKNLLYIKLLPSANDAALVIAQNYPGGVSAFVDKMNENASSWMLYSTHYEDPTGLNDGNYTTPMDLAELASISKKNKIFSEIVSTEEKTVTDISGQENYQLKNLNKLLGFDGVDGIKTGYTEEAGQVLVTSKSFFDESEKRKRSIIIVVMGSQDRFYDTQRLLDLVSGNITYLSIHP